MSPDEQVELARLRDFEEWVRERVSALQKGTLNAEQFVDAMLARFTISEGFTTEPPPRPAKFEDLFGPGSSPETSNNTSTE